MNYKIEPHEAELNMLKEAVDFYVRMNLGQFKEIERLKIAQKADSEQLSFAIITLEQIAGLSRGSYFGIFNHNVLVKANLLCEMHDQMRYAQNVAHKSDRLQEPDICWIAKLPLPDFSIAVVEGKQ